MTSALSSRMSSYPILHISDCNHVIHITSPSHVKHYLYATAPSNPTVQYKHRDTYSTCNTYSTYLIQAQEAILNIVALGRLTVECRSFSLQFEHGHSGVVTLREIHYMTNEIFRWLVSILDTAIHSMGVGMVSGMALFLDITYCTLQNNSELNVICTYISAYALSQNFKYCWEYLLLRGFVPGALRVSRIDLPPFGTSVRPV